MYFDVPFIRTLSPLEKIPEGVFFPQQVHGSRTQELIHGQEDRTQCDGLWTKNPQFLLGIKMADCAAIAPWDKEKFGLFHVGWRGVVNGLCENILDIFPISTSAFFIGPFFPVFEIQRDDCFTKINHKFGEQFFEFRDGKIFFHFGDALFFFFPHAQWDGRSSFENKALASWRRDKTKARNYMIIGRKNFEK